MFQNNKEKNGFTLTINEGNKLCGKLKIDISKKIDTAGEYLLTSKQLSGLSINVIFVIVGSIAILIGVGVYIGVKKQYWFW